MIYEPLVLDRPSYSLTEIYVIINEYCHQALRHHEDKSYLLMERVVRPSIFLLKGNLKADAKNWRDAKCMDFEDLYLVRNSVRNVIDVLVRASSSPSSLEHSTHAILLAAHYVLGCSSSDRSSAR